MTSRLRNWLEHLGEAFWLRPAALVLLGLLLGLAMVWAERAGVTEDWVSGGWIYAGGEAGARSLLSAIASSTIGVAGTVFSITVAALSLASGQMGPRLLRNFVRDPGNQIALGIFLGTFTYALVLLRTVRSVDEVTFVPHLGVTAALLLALLSVGTLVWFVHHIANSINVNTVIGIVHAEVSKAISTLPPAIPAGDPPNAPSDEPSNEPADERADNPESRALPAHPVVFRDGGYLRSLDEAALADWAASRGVMLRLRVRPGDYLFPGAAVGHVRGTAEALGDGASAEATFAAAAAVGSAQSAAQDLEFGVRQLVEVGVRALSSGINDPFTAVAVLDHLAALLCEIAGRRLPDPVLRRDGRPVLVRRVTDYDGLCDTMFHPLRQDSAGSAIVLIRLVEVLQRVEEIEQNPRRRATLRRHLDLALATGRRELTDGAGIVDFETRGAAGS